MAFTQKLFTSYHGYDNPDTRIGEINRIWYDSINNVFRIQLDTYTPGGTIIGGGGSGGSSYTLPTATANRLGGVKIGSNITITNGVISVAAPFSGSYTDLTNKPSLFSGSYNDLTNKPTIPDAYILPTASNSTLGGVKIDGTTITIANGVISATQPNLSSYVTLTGTQTLTNKTLTSPTITDGVFSNTFTIGTQVFYAHTNGFSVNENFDITDPYGTQANFTGYHYTSGSGKTGVAFTLARTGNFTDGFGITGDASNNNFVIGSETANTDFVFKTGIGMPFDVSGGSPIFTINRDGSLTFADTSVQTTAWLGYVTQVNSPSGGTYTALILNADGTISLPIISSQSFSSIIDGSDNTQLTLAKFAGAYTKNAGNSNGGVWNSSGIAGSAINLFNDGHITLTTNNGAVPPAVTTYSFSNTGNFSIPASLTFPDTTVQTTAWLGSTNTIFKLNPSAGPGDHFRAGAQADLTNGLSIITSIGTGGTGTVYSWKFGFDGNLTFPDTTVQTTAYTDTRAKGLFSVTTNSASGNGSLSYSSGVFTFTPASVPTSVTINGTAVTLGSSGTVTAAAGTLTGTTLNSTVVSSSLTSVGTLSSLNVSGATTLSTETITGTGENLFLYSNTFNNSYWRPASGLATPTNTITDPFGGSTAWAIPYVSIYQSLFPTIFLVSGVTYTISYWLQATSGTRTFILFGASSSTNYGSITATTTWTRYSTTFTMVSTEPLYVLQDRNASGFQTLNIYGAQLEIGSVANTYIPTTTTIVYGTPTLSFSGVSTIGLQNDGSLFVQPAGTGALQAQQTTSTTAGGNARGTNAVDLQTSRSANTQVASGANSVITGGYNNTASGSQSYVGGGFGNSVPQANAAIVGGGTNTNNSYYGFIGGGAQNSIGGQDASVIVGGRYNTAGGFYNFIGGGSLNTAQSGSVVTTCTLLQSIVGMMYIAVTNTNNSVRVGMLITGPGINGGTYVNSYAVNPVSASAMTTTISGTTLTVASGFTGALAVGSTLTGGSISPAGTYITGQLTAANTASATPTLSSQANSAATTLSVSSASGIQINMFVASSSGGSLSGLPANTYVVSIVGTTITISNALTGTISSGTSIGFFTAGIAGTYSLSGTTPSGTPTNGTAYTIQLSQQVASSQTSGTIGFYLAGSTVVGGAKNTASGLFSFVGGGGGWTTAGNQIGALNNGPNANTASGDWSTIGGGTGNVASGAASTIAGGGSGYSGFFAGNTASGYSSSIIGGGSNSASGQYSSILGGLYNTANGDYSVAMGYMAYTKGNQGSIAASQIRFASNGDNQTCTYLLSLLTSDATPRQMVWSGINATNTVYNYNIIAMSRGTGYLAAYCHTFKGLVSARQPSTNDVAGWEVSGVVIINPSTLVASFVGTPIVNTISYTSGASTWAISMSLVNSSPNTSNGFSGYTIQVTGVAATTIHWSARIDTVEVG